MFGKKAVENKVTLAMRFKRAIDFTKDDLILGLGACTAIWGCILLLKLFGLIA
jgi:hypothetical protein